MEDYVPEYIDDIRNYAARPTLAMYAASRLADDMVNGKLEDWRAVRDAVWQAADAWRPNRNDAVVTFNRRTWDHTPAALDAARERYLSALSTPREPLTGTAEDIDHSDPSYWQSVNGDLSAADIEAEEKFE